MCSPYFPERDGELIAKGGIMKNNKCPSCETDLLVFCFQDILDEANAKAKDIVEKAKESAKTIKNKKAIKCCKKNKIEVREVQGDLF